MRTDIFAHNAFRFLGLILLQLIIIDNIQISGYVNPFIYVLFIMLLPLNISVTLSMFLALLIGLVNDFFANTGAIHAAASVFLAFSRPIVLRLLAPPAGYEDVITPSIKDLGISWFLTYSLLLIFIHHTTLFFLEIFSFSEIFFTILKILGSLISSLILILIGVFLFSSKSKTHR